MSRLDRFLDRIATVVAGGEPEDIPPVVIDVQRNRIAAALGAQLSSWTEHPYTKRYMDYLDSEAELLHDRLVRGDIDAAAYRESFTILERIKVLPTTEATKAKAAENALADWSKDGTLSDVDEYLADQGQQEVTHG